MIVASQETVEKTPHGPFSLLTSIHTNFSLLTSAIKTRREDSQSREPETRNVYLPLESVPEIGLRQRTETQVTTCSPGAWGLSHQVKLERSLGTMQGVWAQAPTGDMESHRLSLSNSSEEGKEKNLVNKALPWTFVL